MVYQASFPNIGTVNDDHTGDQFEVGAQKLVNNLAVMPWTAKTLNAGFFAVNGRTGVSLGLTAVQIIQAAITYAVANSFTAVFIPAKAMDGTVLLPYDASQVTFNSTVLMLCEGGPTDAIDPVAYGADKTGGSDSWAALQAAANNSFVGGNVTPIKGRDGTYRISRPWRLLNQKWRVHGSRKGFVITPTSSFVGGPLVFSQADDATNGRLPLVAPLVTGSGNSLDLSAASETFYIDFRDATKTLDMNGLGAFTVELFFQPTALVGQNSIISSGGAVSHTDLSGSQPPEAFTFRLVQTDGTHWALNCQVNIGGVQKTFNGAGNFTIDGVPRHVAVTYDGTTLRSYIGGVQQASVAASGTLTQAQQEQTTVGQSVKYAPDATANFAHAPGYYYSIRFSNTARYTGSGSFTPPSAALGTDANTLLLWLGDLQDGLLTRCYVGASNNCWAWARTLGSKDAALPATDHPFWDGAYFSGADTHTGLVIDRCVYPTLKNLEGVGRGGIYFYSESFFGSLEDIDFATISNPAPASRYGIVAPNFSSQHWRNVDVLGFAFPMTAVQVQADNLYIEAHSETVYAFSSMGNGSQMVLLNSPFIDAEGLYGGSTIWRGAILIANAAAAGTPGCFTINGGLIDTGKSSAAIAPIVIDQADQTVINNPLFYPFGAGAGVPSTITIKGAPRTPVRFTSAPRNATYPLSDIAGWAVLDSLGKGTAITYAATLNLDCSGRDQFEITALTGALTLNLINATPGQRISISTVQNAGGGNAITFGTINTTGAFKGATANDTTGLHYSKYLFEIELNLNAVQVGFSSGA